MKVKLLLIILVVFAAVFILVAFQVASKSPQTRQAEPSNDRLRWHIAQAKKEGRQKVTISTGVNSYLGSENKSIENAFADYTVVIAKPITQKTYQRDDNNLRTWYKFQIVERLTELKDSKCLECFKLTAPPDLLPLNSDEFLVPRDGGRIVLDGVEIEQTEPGFPEFQNNKEYLLFLSFYPERVALTAGGPIGAFAVDQNLTLTSLNKDTDTIQDEIKTKFNNSLGLVKKKLGH